MVFLILLDLLFTEIEILSIVYLALNVDFLIILLVTPSSFPGVLSPSYVLLGELSPLLIFDFIASYASLF